MSAAVEKPPAAPLLEMAGVAAVAYPAGRRVVVSEVDWRVAAGDFWVLAGPHGAGKTDLLMVAANLAAPEAGRAWLFGEPMPVFDEARLATRLRVGLVFDGGRLFQHLTLVENLALPLCYHRNLAPGDAAARVTGLLEGVGLGPWAETTPGLLPRRLHKRAGLARALALAPELLLLDHPLSGSDPWEARWWLDFLEGLSAGHPLAGGRPVTLVATAESLGPWEGCARQFAVLSEQRLRVVGGWADVLRSADPAVRRMLSTGPRPANLPA